jgi:hypothetical protein
MEIPGGNSMTRLVFGREVNPTLLAASVHILKGSEQVYAEVYWAEMLKTFSLRAPPVTSLLTALQ